MSTLKTDNISPNGSTVNVTSVLNVQGGATLAAATITGNLTVDGNVFGVNATTNTVTVSSPANTTPVLLLGVSANAGNSHRSIFRFGHDQNSSSIPVGEIHGVVDNTSSARAGHIEFSTANGGVTAERMRIESNGKIVVNNARGDVGAGTVLTGQNALGTIHFVQNTTNDNWVGMTTSATVDSANTSQGGILIQGSGTYGTKIHFLTTDSYAAGQQNRMTIDHYGKVGIGTSLPLVPLDVRGGSVRADVSGSFEQSVAFSSGAGGWARGLFFVDSTATGTLSGITGGIGVLGSGTSPSSIFIGHGGSPWSGTQGIHLLKNGNVGVGTSVPTSLLHLYGANPVLNIQNTSTSAGSGGELVFGHDQASSTLPMASIKASLVDGGGGGARAGDLKFYTSNAGSLTEKMIMTKDGKLGIGTSTPVANTPLLVQGPGDGIATIRLQIGSSSGGLNYGSMIASGAQSGGAIEPSWINSFVLEGVPLADSTGASGSTIISSFERPLLFQTGARVERMRITTTGNVGIGTNAPTVKLDVNGVVQAGAVSVVNSTASTSTTTGAIVVAGGVGVAGALTVGAGISAGGNLKAANFSVTNPVTPVTRAGYTEHNVGYANLGPIIIQWGRVSGLTDLAGSGGGNQRDVLFPIAFPNACANVQVTSVPEESNATYAQGVYANSLSTTKFTIGWNGGYEDSAFWLAVGY